MTNENEFFPAQRTVREKAAWLFTTYRGALRIKQVARFSRHKKYYGKAMREILVARTLISA